MIALHGKDTVDLVGLDDAGLWVVLARALAGNTVQRTAADLHGFTFAKLTSTADEALLPGALKYGDMTALAALCAPGKLFLAGVPDTSTRTWIADAYRTAGHANQLQESTDSVPASALVDWLLR